MKGVYLFLANGFEETEALATGDVLKRGGIPVKTVSIYEDKYVTSAHNVTVVADLTFGEFKAAAGSSCSGKNDVMIFPGGMPGSTNLADKTELMELMQKHYAEGGAVAAICAAPSVVLSRLPGLSGKKMTCYDGFEKPLLEHGVKYAGNDVETDGNIITGRGPGLSIPFGLAILAYLAGDEKAAEVKAGMML